MSGTDPGAMRLPVERSDMVVKEWLATPVVRMTVLTDWRNYFIGQVDHFIGRAAERRLKERRQSDRRQPSRWT